MNRVRIALRRRHNRLRDDDRGSLPMAMLVMLVGVGLTAALAPMAISQRKTTTFDMTRVHSLNAAQTGVDVVVGKIRNAVGSLGGDPTQLPCTVSADQATSIPLTGSVGADDESYSVTVKYYVSDPIAHPTAVAMKCVTGHGTYDTASGSVVPQYAKIVSTGTDGVDPDNTNGGSLGRTLTSIYAFDVDNSNISGGTLRSYPASADGSATWCLDVGSGNAVDGLTSPVLQPCSTSYPADAQQVFSYRTDLTLQLTTSIGTVVNGVTYRNGLCLDIKTFNSNRTGPASNSGVVLRQCGALGSPIWSQQWSFDDHSSLQAPFSSSASNGQLSGLCMTVANHSAGTGVTLSSCDGNLTSPTDAWIPSPSVGAGAATSATSQQWINFQQFGRCINVPNSDPDALYIIAPGCKQNPNAASVAANQKLIYNSTTQQFYLNLNSTNYCVYSTNSQGGLVRVTPCSRPASGIAASQLKWVRTSPALTPTLSYSQQFRFIDQTGLCLSLADVPSVPNDRYGSTYSVWYKLVTLTCDLSTLQQWNASNNVGNSSIQNTREN